MVSATSEAVNFANFNVSFEARSPCLSLCILIPVKNVSLMKNAVLHPGRLSSFTRLHPPGTSEGTAVDELGEAMQ